MIVKNTTFRRLLTYNYFTQPKLQFMPIRYRTSKTETENDAPVPFLNSPAAKYHAREFRHKLGRHNSPEAEPFIVSLSLGALLVYFCILRTENDLDEMLYSDLHLQVPGLEIQALRNKKRTGGDFFTIADQKRLEELEKQYGQ